MLISVRMEKDSKPEDVLNFLVAILESGSMLVTCTVRVIAVIF